MKRSHELYSWSAHAKKYLEYVSEVIASNDRDEHSLFETRGTRLPTVDRLLLSNLEDTITGDSEATEELLNEIRRARCYVGFGLTSGSPLKSVLETLAKVGVPVPDVLISAAGTEIYYGKMLVADRAWQKHIRFRWDREKVLGSISELPELELRTEDQQTELKVSCRFTSDSVVSKRKILTHLRSCGVRANVVVSQSFSVDILPIRASTGHAIRHLAWKWGLNPEEILAVGSSGSEEAMLSGNTLGAVVDHYSPEIKRLKGRPRIYFTEKRHAWGVLEAISYYDFFGAINVPAEIDSPEVQAAAG